MKYQWLAALFLRLEKCYMDFLLFHELYGILRLQNKKSKEKGEKMTYEKFANGDWEMTYTIEEDRLNNFIKLPDIGFVNLRGIDWEYAWDFKHESLEDVCSILFEMGVEMEPDQLASYLGDALFETMLRAQSPLQGGH